MLRKLLWLLPLVPLVLIAALAVSCSSSSSSTTVNQNCTDGPYNIVGNWQINVTPSGGTPAIGYGAIDSAGLAVFFDTSPPNASGDSGGTLQMPSLTGACYFTGSIISSPEAGTSGSVVSDTLQGNVVSATSITGTFSGVSSGSMAAVPFTPLSGSATALSGSQTGQIISGVADTLTLTFTPGTGASMSFSGTDTLSCTVSGTFTQVGTSNVFDVTYVYAGAAPCVAATSTGIGFESTTDYFDMNSGAAGTYLYADILSSSGPFVLEIFQ
jgi:hypothetical protein